MSLTIEELTQRIEHQFELTNARLDRLIFLFEELVYGESGDESPPEQFIENNLKLN